VYRKDAVPQRCGGKRRFDTADKIKCGKVVSFVLKYTRGA
jgi:hypothetical protein